MPYTVVVDVMAILESEGRVLLAERARTGYADGHLNLPSGKLEAGESVVEAVIREAREEIAVQIAPEDLRLVHVMQHRNLDGHSRIGYFFAAARWGGQPRNNEPEKCAGLLWAPIDELPGHTWPYTAAGIDAYRRGVPFSLDGFDMQLHALEPR